MLSAGDVRDVPRAVRRRVRRRRALADRCRCRRASRSSGTTDSTYIRKPPFFEDMTTEPAPLTRHRRRARAGAARRQRHDRSHLAGGLDQGGQPGGEVSDRARRQAGGLQLVRRAPRQSRSDDARHVREHPAAQPAGAGHRRRLDDAISPAASVMTIYDASMKYQRRRRAADGASPARNTGPGRRATGRRRARCCSA